MEEFNVAADFDVENQKSVGSNYIKAADAGLHNSTLKVRDAGTHFGTNADFTSDDSLKSPNNHDHSVGTKLKGLFQGLKSGGSSHDHSEQDPIVTQQHHH